MPKFGRVGAARRKRRARRPTELANAVEGWLAEICRDLAVQVKRMRQLHEQADELQRVFRRWAGQSEADSTMTESVVEDNAEK